MPEEAPVGFQQGRFDSQERMDSLRQKLIFSYALLILVSLAIGGWGIHHLIGLGRAIDVILVNNYKSVLAAENMKEALERQVSSALFFILRDEDGARQQFVANSGVFEEELRTAASNVTEPGEEQIIADIGSMFAAYKDELNTLLNSPQAEPHTGKAEVYFSRLEPRFLAIKARVDDLLHLNQQAMVTANERAISKSWEAEVSLAMLSLLAIALALTFAWKFTNYVVQPLQHLTEKARLVGEGDFDQYIRIMSKDEIGVLAAEFNRMAARLRDLRQTERWQLLLERKKSDAVLEALYEPVIVTDAQGHVTKVNRPAAELFRRSRKQEDDDQDYSLSGLSAGEQILRAVRDVVALQKPVAQEGEAALVPMKFGEAERSYRLRTTPMRDTDGRLVGAVTLLEDITSLKEIDRLKTEFIAIASAKLRGPLRSLQYALYSVIEGYAGQVSDQQVELLLDARQNAEQLDELMGDLLELAEIESGARNLTTERLRPVDIARAVVEQFQAGADSKHVKLTNAVWSDVPWVIADRRAMRRIFGNLLSNAIRHTPRDGEIKISAEERIGRVLFQVRDTGEGIPEAYLPALFNRFVRIGERTSGGAGLGLALVKRLVEAQGGQVSVESRPGEGTTFMFTLPVGGPSATRK